MLTAVVALSALGASAAPVAATEGTRQPDLRACFKFSNDAIYSQKPALLYKWDSTSRVWRDTGRAVLTFTNGCARFNDVAMNQRYYIHAHWNYDATWAYWGDSGQKFVGSEFNVLHTAPDGVVGGPYRR